MSGNAAPIREGCRAMAPRARKPKHATLLSVSSPLSILSHAAPGQLSPRPRIGGMRGGRGQFMSDLSETVTNKGAALRQIAIARRELAANARELARGMMNELARMSLLAHADEFDAQAAALEEQAELQQSEEPV
jgi:hypothetical protein